MVRTMERVTGNQPCPLSVIPSHEFVDREPDAELVACGVTDTSTIDLEVVRAMARERGARHRGQTLMRRS